MRKATVAVTLATMIAVACSDSADPTAGTPQRVIIATNNGVTTTQWGPFTPLDALFKQLYERNNDLSRRGEADNNAASGANLNLSNIFSNPGPVLLTDAQSAINAFDKDINTALKGGKYNPCSAPQLTARGAEIYNILQAVIDNNNTLDPAFITQPAWVTDPTVCGASPVEFLAATGSSTNGVTLTYNDPWHYDNDPRSAAQGHVDVYVTFYLNRYDPATNSWVNVALPSTFANVHQTGATTLTFADPGNTTPGTYTYAVQQCDNFGACSTWANGTVIVPDPNSGGGGQFGCVHDNRNGFLTKDNKTKECPKTDKIHPNINGNGKNS